MTLILRLLPLAALIVAGCAEAQRPGAQAKASRLETAPVTKPDAPPTKGETVEPQPKNELLPDPIPGPATRFELLPDPTPAGKESEKTSLYKRLGETAGIVKVVDDFVTIVAADANIRDKHRKHFMEGDVPGLKKKLVDQIGEATGGPQKYTGKNMKDAHKGMEITNKDFDNLAADLVKALDKNKVPADAKNELLKMLETMRKDVVEKND